MDDQYSGPGEQQPGAHVTTTQDDSNESSQSPPPSVHEFLKDGRRVGQAGASTSLVGAADNSRAALASASASGRFKALPSGRQFQVLYKTLGVSQIASFEDIHVAFMRHSRQTLRELDGQKLRPARQELLGSLRKLSIANDILTDPSLRTDYDLRELGLRGSKAAAVPTMPEDTDAGASPSRPMLRIGELLQCSGLLEQTELDIAVDMHKAVPEVMFGSFLVQQGFIGEQELDSVLFGQKLLRLGAVSVAQFQVCMELAKSRDLHIGEVFIEKGYVTESTLEKLADLDAHAPAGESPMTATAITSSVPVSTPVEVSNAMPSWTDQLDWEAPEPTAPESVAEAMVNNAAPSWTDQIDWESSDVDEPESSAEDALPQPSVGQPVAKSSLHGQPPASALREQELVMEMLLEDVQASEAAFEEVLAEAMDESMRSGSFGTEEPIEVEEISVNREIVDGEVFQAESIEAELVIEKAEPVAKKQAAKKQAAAEKAAAEQAAAEQAAAEQAAAEQAAAEQAAAEQAAAEQAAAEQAAAEQAAAEQAAAEQAAAEQAAAEQAAAEQAAAEQAAAKAAEEAEELARQEEIARKEEEARKASFFGHMSAAFDLDESDKEDLYSYRIGAGVDSK